MAFKLYTDKSSLRKKNSRYIQGGTSEVTGDKISWWEREKLPRDDTTDFVYKLNSVYAGKPDLIAYDLYGRADLAWIVLQYNNIVDISEELVAGKEIVLPSVSRVLYEILDRGTVTQRAIR